MNVAFHAQHLDILSLCTGGGGLDLGIELAIPCARSVVCVEREAFAVAHLVSAMEAGLMAPAPIWSDARTFDGNAWRGSVDGLIGGIPCQGHSLAGKKRGSLDERDLWSPTRRIIVQARPWFVLIENVSGMLSPGDDEIAGAERVWRDLRKLGFAVEGGLFTAAEVGASHQRERVFILAVADDALWRRGDPSIAGRRDGPEKPAGGRGVDVADAGSAGLEGTERGRSSGERHGPEAHGSTPQLCGAPVADSDDRIGEQHARQWHDAGDGAAQDRQRPHAEPAGPSGALVDAESIGRREGWPEPEFRSGRRAAASASGEQSLVHAADGLRRSVGRSGSGSAGESGSEAFGWGICEGDRRPDYERSEPSGGLFPPGPADLNAWRTILERAPELEPAIRRVADGLASRVDRLRMLGNGVVPLQASHAVRTLAARLAARGSAGAARLVRMMEAAA